MPLVVMLHGCRQTALSFAQGSRMNQWADAAGFMVLYPQQSMARQVQRCWRWFQPDALHGGGEADLIAALVRSEVGRHGLDPTRVYIAGLSAGAGAAPHGRSWWRRLAAFQLGGDGRCGRAGGCKPCAGARPPACRGAGKRGQSGRAGPLGSGRHGLDPTRVYIAGLSAGAGMAAVALRHPQWRRWPCIPAR